MLNSKRNELCTYLRNKIRRIISKKELLNSMSESMYDRYGINPSESNKVLTLSVDLETLSDEMLYCILSVIDEKKIKDFFTDFEIDVFREIDFSKEEEKSLSFKMIQIEEDQWIGKITIKQIEELSDSSMIRYNPTTQRPLKRVVVGEDEYYKIAINEKAVKEITSSFENENYIPNTITLNIPLDQTIPYYDETTCTLHVDDIRFFDIIDGYHRYAAAIRLAKLNPGFNYSMELRITAFSTEKSRQFIWQEDQKTKMKKIDAKNYNVNNAENRTVMQLEAKGGLIHGLIGKQNIIDSAELASAIAPFFDNVDKKNEVKKIIEVRELIAKKLEELINENPDIVETRWERSYIIAFAYCVYKDMELSEIDSVLKDISEIKASTKVARLYENPIKAIEKHRENGGD